MAEIFTLQQSDDLSSVVERIRSASDEEVAVLIPKDRQTFINPTTLRLLLRFSQESKKTTRIIANDARVQKLAMEAGYTVFPTIQSFHDGKPVLPARGLTDSAPVREEMPSTSTADEEPVAPVPAPTPSAPNPHIQPAARQAGKMTRTDASWIRTRGGKITIGSVAAVIILVLLVFVIPSATVTLTLNGTPLSEQSIIEGSPSGSSTGANNTIQTNVLTANSSQTFQATPTGTTDCCGAAASGGVLLSSSLQWNDLTASGKSNCPQGPSCPGYYIYLAKGSQFEYSSGGNNVIYQSTAAICDYFAWPQGGNNASQTGEVYPGTGDSGCTSTGGQQQLGDIPVQDVKQEALGNDTPSGATVTWLQDPCNSSNNSSAVSDGFPFNCPNLKQGGTQSSPFSADVPQGVTFTGGIDPKQVPAASQADITAFQQQVATLETTLTAKLKSQLTGELNGEVEAIDPGGNGESITFTVTPALPQTAGSQWNTTTETVSGSAAVTVYSLSAVKESVVDALKSQVTNNEVYAPESLNFPAPTVTEAGSDGSVILSVNASAYSVPQLPKNLRSQLTGRSPGGLTAYLQSIIGDEVSSVETVQSPYPFFTLPFLSSHITIDERFKTRSS